jgi:glycosidase
MTKKTLRTLSPPFWFVDMKHRRLQLMVTGNNIAGASVTTDYPGVSIEDVVSLDSPNYLFVYMNIAAAKAGNMQLTFRKEGWTETIEYQLKRREKRGEERKGFSNEDVLYLLMPDRFAQGTVRTGKTSELKTETSDCKQVVDRSQPSLRHGGNLDGIREHLDYFVELGVTALWLTPVQENASPDSGNGHSTYHGYAITDYYSVDPHLGSNESYRQLVDAAHGKGLKVVMDMIFNHCSIDHPWTKDMPSKDWFHFVQNDGSLSMKPENNVEFLQTSYKLTPVLDPYASQVDKKETVEGWLVPTMPDLNQRNPHLMAYLMQNSIWWIETVGIDGIRMDTYPYADREAMAQWMERLNKEYPNLNTVGETWVAEPAYTAAWQQSSPIQPDDSHLKTVMYFAFFDRINKAKHEETDDWCTGFNRIYNTLAYDYLYADPSSVMAFIDNHDTDRFLGNTKDPTMLKQALALLLTINRIPQLYYGTEILMNGTKFFTDGDVRRDFPGGFPQDIRNAFTRKGRTSAENAMFDWLSRLLHWRKNSEIIAKGRQVQFIPYQGIYVVARQLKTIMTTGRNTTVLTILNGKHSSNVVKVARYAELIGDAKAATDIITGESIDLTHDFELAPSATLILQF